MDSLGSLHFSLTEIRRLDGNYALYPHSLISDQCSLYWLTRRFWSIICPSRCMERALYTSITGQYNSRLHVYLLICLCDQLCTVSVDNVTAFKRKLGELGY